MSKKQSITRKGVFKTEAAKTVEYSPSKSIYMDSSSLSNEVEEEWDKIYRDGLRERLLEFKPTQAYNLSDGFYRKLVLFNKNMDKPEWFWNEEEIQKFDLWILRDVVVLLENGRELGKKTL